MTEHIHDGTVDYGTPERRQKSKMEVKARGVSNGGRVISTGLTDTQHSPLDLLLTAKYITQSQYDVGYKLRELYYSFNRSPTLDISPVGGGKTEQTQDCEIDAYQDRQETKYHAVMRATQKPYGHICRSICVYDEMPQVINAHTIQFALHLLEKAFREVEKITLT